MEGKETPTNINMGLYRKWVSSFLECPPKNNKLQDWELLENFLELFCKTILLKQIVELQNNCIFAIVKLCDFVEQFCSEL
jgi:hypothetical protein